ncbi:glyoxalase [Aureicoccus marinus]|uniref:Glyoxalase n=1 Tax=Aureicoccus marinus TaxID=754435 RepID=A0A2S7T524_9FLAO|nr:glyoxalase [Aureicoccus marinus]PQJ15032.1 glyoxalase [Aureicoccus marinus]
MNSRSSDLIRIRPDIKSAQINDLMSDEERFQNETIRPILKMQNDLFVLVFKNYILKHKNVFLDLSFDRKSTYIENAIQKDIKFRNSLKGMVIGMFSLEEYQRYILNSSALNKRMMNMLMERLKDQMQLFSEETIVS